MRKISLLLLLLLAGGCIAGCFWWQWQTGQDVRIADGVTLLLHANMPIAIGGWTAAELNQRLEIYAQKSIPAIEPQVDPVTKGIVPGLCGQGLDVAATAAAAFLAAPGEEVGATWAAIYPPSLWEDSHYPIYQGHPSKKAMAIVINVAWGNENLPEMLEILRSKQVRASFFLVGRWAAANAALVQLIVDDGHELGNHAYSDPHLPMLDREAIAREITATSEVIAQVSEQSVRFFSPPYNDFDQKVLDVASELGYLTVLCSLDTADWMRQALNEWCNV